MSIALSGGINTFGEFSGTTKNNFINGLSFFLVQAGMKMKERVKASASADVPGTNPADGTTYSFGGQTYTFKGSINNAVQRQVKIGADAQTSMDNLVAAVNIGSGQGTIYSNATFQNSRVSLSESTVGMITTLTATALVGGTDGNGIPSDLGTLLGGGFKLTAYSPQNRFIDGLPLKATIYVYDSNSTSGGFNRASIRMLDYADETVASSEMHVKIVSGRRYRVICCQCQFFCYVAGVDAETIGSVVCGGIPSIPTGLCGEEVMTLPANDIWWISNDAGGVANATPRTIIVDQGRVTETAPNVSHDPTGSGVTSVNPWLATDACFNGTVTFGSGSGANHGHFRMVAMTPPTRWDITLADAKTLINSMLWFGALDAMSNPTDAAMLLEPLVSWALVDNLHDPLVRGQFYDSWIKTAQANMDDTDASLDGFNMIAFTHRSKFGTLWLIVPSLTPVTFETFQASYAH